MKNHFGEDACLTSITTESINEWIMGLMTIKGKDVAILTKINHKRNLNNLLNHCVKQKWIKENPCTNSISPKAKQAEISFYSVEDMEKLITNATNRDSKLQLILGAFCGMRTKEIETLDWSYFNFEEGYVQPNGKTGKRLHELSPNALTALKLLKKKSGLVIDGKNLRRRTIQMFKSAKVVKLDNGYRHSYGTFHFAKFKDWMKTTVQMGNSKDVLERHYNGLTAKSQGVLWFELELV